MSKATTRIIIDHLHPKKDNTCGIYLRVTYDRKIRHFSISRHTFTKEEFDNMFGKRPKADLKAYRFQMQEEEARANAIIEKMKNFSFEAFEEQFVGRKDIKNKVFDAFSEEAKKLRAKGRIRSAIVFECAMKNLEKFRPNMKFTDLTKKFCEEYEDYMLDAGRSVTTISMYLRSLRTLLNIYQVPREYYPFSKYEIPAERNTKKALNLADIQKIFKYKPISKEEGFYRDVWLFQYLCAGINVADAVQLKWSNIKGESLKYGIKGDTIEFYRQKSRRTKKEVTPVVIPINDDIKLILSRIAKKKSEYVLPILDGSEDPARIVAKIQQFTKMINKYINIIADKLKLGKVTTYTARHSFATVLLRSGANINLISEALGHSSVNTTKLYLAGFDLKAKQQAFRSLTEFKK